MDRDNIEANKRADRSCYFFGYDIKSRWIMGELKKFVNRFLFFSLSLSTFKTRGTTTKKVIYRMKVLFSKRNHRLFCIYSIRLDVAGELGFNFKFLARRIIGNLWKTIIIVSVVIS